MALNKKKIIVFTDWYFPGYKAGGPITSCMNFAAYMKDDYEIYILTGDRDLADNSPYEGVKSDQWVRLDGYFVFYASPRRLSLLSLRSIVASVGPDYIYLNSMFSLHFSIYPLLLNRFRFFKSRLVMAPRGMLKNTAMRFKSTKKQLFLRLFKLLKLGEGIRWQATDETEVKDIICKLSVKKSNVFLVPNFPGIQKNFIPVREKRVGKLKMVFVGRVHPVKNLDFLFRALTGVCCSVELTIIGAVEDSSYWSQCQQIGKSFSEKVTVQLLEAAPHHKIEEILLSNHLFVLPTTGENFGHAIFEALAVGRPVLISDQTPWRCLKEAFAGWDLPLGKADDFIEMIEFAAAMDIEAMNKWCMGAWTYCNNYLKLSGTKRKYMKLFD